MRAFFRCTVVGATIAVAASIPFNTPVSGQSKGNLLLTAAAQPARLDANGDPLPPGVLMRLGSARFQHGQGLRRVAFSPCNDVLASCDAAGPGIDE
jgi:hypothetical protein